MVISSVIKKVGISQGSLGFMVSTDTHLSYFYYWLEAYIFR